MAFIYQTFGEAVFDALKDIKESAAEILPDIDYRIMEGYFQDELNHNADTIVFVPHFADDYTHAMGNLDVENTIMIECYVIVGNKKGRHKRDYIVHSLDIMTAIMNNGRSGRTTILRGGDWHVVSSREKSGFVSQFNLEINILRKRKEVR